MPAARPPLPFLFCLSLVLLHGFSASSARADEAAPNPLAAAAGVPRSGWAGRYATANGAVELTLGSQEKSYLGKLTLRAPTGPLRFVVSAEEKGEMLIGHFRSAEGEAQRFPLELRRGPQGRLVLRSGPHRHELARTRSPDQTVTPAPDAVTFNGVALPSEVRQALEGAIGAAIPAGAYWYDPRCGAVGLQGGPTLGFLAPNLSLGGRLSPRASGGGTNVFVNGREIHPTDVANLSALLGRVPPGRYWLDAQGNYGVVGRPASGNLVQVAQRGASAGGGGQQPYTIYRDFGGRNGKVHFGSFGNGDFYFSNGSTSWWPGK